ncbi:MAG TPA: undecaprenyl-phosphate glucose phosphotransferase, partial [Polyangiaceae bacterium]|nr:undecaprenyl-phosphate glucose phosphotransferase [Polyangiaceae bacterium]
MADQGKVRDGVLRNYASVINSGQRLCDSALIVVALVLMTRAYHEPWSDRETIAACAAVITHYLVAEFNGLYRAWRGLPAIRELATVVSTWTVTAMVLLLVAFATKRSEDHSRVITFGWFLVTPNLMIVFRLVIRFVLQELRRNGRNSRSVVIVGMTRAAQKLTEQMNDPVAGFRLAGFYDDRIPSRRQVIEGTDVEFRGGTDELIRDVIREKIDYVYIALPLRAESRISELVQRLSDTTASVLVVGDFFVFDMLHSQWSMVGDVPVVSILDTPFQGLGGWVKRFEDIVLGTLILMLIAIPMAIIAFAVKLTSPGPVFFVQRRYGLHGNEIPVIKFRTMSVMEDGGDVRQATAGDARITRLGAFLRRTSLDELPQFFNVLAGHMSIVGPRPHAVAHNEIYRSKIHRYMLRHKVKPGITGWAQVNGWRGETETLHKMEKRLEHDLYYIH